MRSVNRDKLHRMVEDLSDDAIAGAGAVLRGGDQGSDLEFPVEGLMQRARPLRLQEEMVIDDLSEEETAAFLAAVLS